MLVQEGWINIKILLSVTDGLRTFINKISLPSYNTSKFNFQFIMVKFEISFKIKKKTNIIYYPPIVSSLKIKNMNNDLSTSMVNMKYILGQTLPPGAC